MQPLKTYYNAHIDHINPISSEYTANVDVQNLNTYFERLNVAITERVPAFMVFIVSTNVHKMNTALEH